MTKSNTKKSYHPDQWFVMESETDELGIGFRLFRIEGLDLNNLEDSDISSEPTITGRIKWDGCMNFTQHDHYCRVEQAKHTYEMMKIIYEMNDANNEDQQKDTGEGPPAL